MRLPLTFFRIAASLMLAFAFLPAQAADYPAPKEADWVARDFRFHTGEVMPELKLHYATVGAPTGEPVLILHGTAARASRSTRANTSSSCPTPSAPANRRNLQMACARNFRSTTTTTWCSRSTAS
jgi:hypothetical protein